jgi:tetratricopeptide (TPR) repeat protein
MGKLALGKTVKSLTAASLALLAVLCVQVNANADDQSLSLLAQLEQKLLCQTYSTEEVNLRLNRIEKRVFGQTLAGSAEERIAKLTQAVPVKPVTAQSTPSAVAVPDNESSFGNAQAHSQPQVPSKRNDETERACAMERARIAVLAAKEEEIGGLLAEAVQLWRAKRGNEALERFEQVIRLDPTNAEAHFSMGIIEEGAGSFIEAMTSYQKASRLKPENTDYAEAIKAVEKKLTAKQAFDSRNSELTKLAEDALAAYKRGQYMFALDLYKQLDGMRPNQALVKYNIGTIYMMLKIPHKALEFYKQAAAINPNEPRYVQACQKLQAVVPPMDSNPYSPKPGKPVKQQQPVVNNNQSMGAANSSDPMDIYGLNARSGGKGVVITTIDPSSRASKAGLQKGDVIRAVDGIVVNNPNEINTVLSRKGPNDQVQVMIQRDKNIGAVVL